ncbi:hypothetical protein [Kyrpidia sp.]|uniref:hypothetical protein n=1 Tax=Kyrpidia sp. TaxID=2073077 RepID=UPI00258D4A7E|nr:hypothetical protein [Kyrpidia sp.]MCL6576321.1 hypothetical protein [Kyrpidia sp.]
MTKKVFFDNIWPSVRNILAQSELAAVGIKQLWVIRDLLGRVRLALAEEEETELSDRVNEALRRCAQELHEVLGAHAYDPSQAILLLSRADLEKQGEQSGILKHSIGGMDVWLPARAQSVLRRKMRRYCVHF